MDHEATVTITDDVHPDSPVVTLHVPGQRRRLFNRATKPPQLEAKFKALSRERGDELREQGYEVEFTEQVPTNKAELGAMLKPKVVAFADAHGVEYPADATKREIVEAVAAKLWDKE